MTTMHAITDFFLEIDALKLVNRKTYVKGGERVENSAEHSWQLAMACWHLAEHFNLSVNQERLIKMALLHDLGEIDAGDTFLYSPKRADAHIEERKGIERLQSHQGNAIADLLSLWDEQETGDSLETKLLKAVDRLLPFMHNVATQGKAWQENQVKRSQVAAAHAFIQQDFPEMHAWMGENIQMAVNNGWLKDE